MDLDELKEKWAEHDRKLEMSLRLNRQILRATTLNRARSTLQRLIMGLALEAVIDLTGVVVLGAFVYDHRQQSRFAFPAAALDLSAIVILAALIYQITFALQIDYGLPITAIQEQMETLKILRIRYIQGIFLAATLVWTPLLIVALKGIFGWDAYHLFGPVYLTSSVLLGLIMIPLALWLSKRYGGRMKRWPVMQRLMQDLTGHSLAAATDFLDTLSEFKDEKMKAQCLILFACATLIFSSTPVHAQSRPTQSRSQLRIGQDVRSPEVQPDGRVTFRFRAPNAKNVLLAREDAPPLAMRQNAQGIWSVTTAPLPPDFYGYRFVVDGVGVSDPANPMGNPIVTGGCDSIVHVPGPSSLSWECKDVPHGILHRHLYQSKLIGEARTFWVYTPPGYTPSARHTYPVLYLLHGVMDDASAWTAAGQADIILDNLIAQHKARPMLLVMPFGYGFTDVPDRLAEQFGGPSTQKKIMDVFTRSLLEEVVPQVERTYRVTRSREARAIAGASMGGAQALYIGLNYRDRFAWIGSFSGAFILYGKSFIKWFPALNVTPRPQIRLLWMACGTEDFLLPVNRACRTWLQSNAVHLTTVETPGAHTWLVWRRNLTQFVPLLFPKKQQSPHAVASRMAIGLGGISSDVQRRR